MTGSGIGMLLDASVSQTYADSSALLAAWMIIPRVGYESSSGGPFFRYAFMDCPCSSAADLGLCSDIDFQGGKYTLTG